MKRVNTREKGSCSRLAAAAARWRRMRCSMISISTNRQYIRKVTLAKGRAVSSDRQKAMATSGDAPRPVFVFSTNPKASRTMPIKYTEKRLMVCLLMTDHPSMASYIPIVASSGEALKGRSLGK